MTRNTNILAIVSAVMLSACGGGGGLSIDDLATELATATCEKNFDCCPQDAAMEFDSVDECIGFFSAFATLFTAEVKAAEAAGRVRYDGNVAAGCIDDLRAASCDAFNSGEAEDCEFLIPQVEEGGACEQDFDCVTGFCADTICAQLPGEGDDCDFTCDDGLFCDGLTATCQPQLADGTACVFDDECQSDFCGDDGAGNSVCGQFVCL